MERITVELAERSYPITIGRNLLGQPDFFTSVVSSRNVMIVTNDTIAPIYLETLKQAMPDILVDVIILPDGEKFKTLAVLDQIFTSLLERGHGRDTTLIALGGGVVGDMTGFAAACYQRGIPFIQVPTTLLAQVDSSVGGKTAVNHPLGKNMIGAFYQPRSVIIDINCLKTLPRRELSAGLAEVIKYGIIYDADFFSWLELYIDKLLTQDPDALTYAIKRCCEIKAEVVAKDETEQGLRALLNLGHTYGHAIEAEQGYGNWLHGEAVGAGMVMAAITAKLHNYLNDDDVARICKLIERAQLPLKPPADMGGDVFIKHMMRDKKVLNGTMRLVLPMAIGNAKVVDNVTKVDINKVINIVC